MWTKRYLSWLVFAQEYNGVICFYIRPLEVTQKKHLKKWHKLVQFNWRQKQPIWQSKYELSNWNFVHQLTLSSWIKNSIFLIILDFGLIKKKSANFRPSTLCDVTVSLDIMATCSVMQIYCTNFHVSVTHVMSHSPENKIGFTPVCTIATDKWHEAYLPTYNV